jgi:hypothetical protein
MTYVSSSSGGWSRISLEVDPPLHRLIEAAAAAHDQSIVQYILEAVKDRLLVDTDDRPGSGSLKAETDPVLAELWDNPRDAEYDHL